MGHPSFLYAVVYCNSGILSSMNAVNRKKRDEARATRPADWVWKGSGPPGSSRRNWYNPNTGEWIHSDFPGGDHGPHFDYEDPQGMRWRVFPDKGIMEPK